MQKKRKRKDSDEGLQYQPTTAPTPNPKEGPVVVQCDEDKDEEACEGPTSDNKVSDLYHTPAQTLTIKTSRGTCLSCFKITEQP